MKYLHLLGAFSIMLVSTQVDAAIVGPELISDPGFDDPASWDLGIGASTVENGHLVIINQSGFIFPEPRQVTGVGITYEYSLIVDLVNNLAGGGKVTIGSQTIWEPSYNTGVFNGTIVATDSSGLVFNFLTPYLGRAEFDFVSVKAVVATPVPASLWLLGTGLLGLIGVARRKKA